MLNTILEQKYEEKLKLFCNSLHVGAFGFRGNRIDVLKGKRSIVGKLTSQGFCTTSFCYKINQINNIRCMHNRNLSEPKVSASELEFVNNEGSTSFSVPSDTNEGNIKIKD